MREWKIDGTVAICDEESRQTTLKERTTVPETLIVSSFQQLLQAFAPCFTAPSFQTFTVLCCGWVLTMGRHTVTATIRAANAVGWKHFSSFHRFFAKARWSPDRVGLALVRWIDSLLPKSATLVVAIDDTLGRHTGKKIAGASMHRDPLLSTAQRVLFHWGHVWVVLGINICAFGKVWCLPVLLRLYRSRKRCQADGLAYRKCTELGAELVRLLADALPHRQIRVVGDAAYTNSAMIKGRPDNVTIIGRSRLDAAIYKPPPHRRPGQMGRPRVRGAKLASPATQAAAPGARWLSVDVMAYGKMATVHVFVVNALWYVAAGSEVVRLIVVRNFPGHKRDDCFVCTDPTVDPKTIVETFAQRWALEVTFHDCKGKLGLEDPQNRTERAVQRTAPMALWMYSLVTLWYLTIGKDLRVSQLKRLPWYRQKQAPAFADMLAH